MSEEIEMKLALGESDAERLGRHPRLAGVGGDTAMLANTYYDTPEGTLERARVALRIRDKACRGRRQRLQTLKTSGRGQGGLSIRGEWEWPVSGPGLDLAGLRELPALRDLAPDVLERLAPRFRTDFRRRTWQVDMDGSSIEVALDQGEIVAGDRRATIREVELELKSGEVETLWTLALELAEWVPLRPARASKAARGSALAARRWPLPSAVDTPAACLERAIAALDAGADSGETQCLATARQALSRLATLSPPHPARLASVVAGALHGDASSGEAWLTLETGRPLVALAHALRATQA